jgi:hypothetical protein
MKKYEVPFGVLKSQQGMCTSICKELDKNKKLYLEMYKSYVENPDKMIVKTFQLAASVDCVRIC